MGLFGFGKCDDGGCFPLVWFLLCECDFEEEWVVESCHGYVCLFVEEGWDVVGGNGCGVFGCPEGLCDLCEGG